MPQQPLLGARPVTRQRFGAPIVIDGVPTRPPAVEVVIRAAIAPAPDEQREITPSGSRAPGRIRVSTHDDVRGVDSPGQTYPDRIVVDGRVFEVDRVTRSPAVAGWQSPTIADAVEVEPLAYPGGGAGAAPTMIVPPAIAGEFAPGATLTAIPGVWAGAGPIALTYEWMVGGDVVGTGPTYVLPDDLDGVSVILVETASNGVSPDATAQSQPLGGGGGGPVDCAVTCADAIAQAVAAAVAPLEATIAAQAQTIVTLQGEIVALEEEIVELQGEIVALEAQILAERTAWRVPSLGPETPTLYDPGSLLSAAPSNASGTITFPLKAGVTAAALEQGAALVWPLRDLQGRPIPAGRYLDGPARLYLPALPALGSGIRLAIAVMDGADPATASGFAYGLIPDATGYLAVAWTGTAGTWSPTTASGANANNETGGPTNIIHGSIVIGRGAASVTGPYRSFTATKLNTSSAVGTNANGAANAFAPAGAPNYTHFALVAMTTTSLGSPVSVSARPLHQLVAMAPADVVGVAA